MSEAADFSRQPSPNSPSVKIDWFQFWSETKRKLPIECQCPKQNNNGVQHSAPLQIGYLENQRLSWSQGDTLLEGSIQFPGWELAGRKFEVGAVARLRRCVHFRNPLQFFTATLKRTFQETLTTGCLFFHSSTGTKMTGRFLAVLDRILSFWSANFRLPFLCERFFWHGEEALPALQGFL